MKLRSLLAASLSVLALSATLFVPATVARAAEDCKNVGGKTPVLFVHGFNEEPSVWNDMATAILGVGDIQLRPPFDYKQWAKQWVTNPNIGSALVDKINCAAESSQSHKIIVIAHSMGGDAVLEALKEDPTIKDKLALVVTIGTPNQGSEFAKAAIDQASQLCGLLGATILVSYCKGSELSALEAYSALPALAANSHEVSELPEWPKSVPVLAIAGNIRPTYTVTVFPNAWGTVRIPGPYSNTDGMVTTSSALHGNKVGGLGGTFEYHCLTELPIILPIITPADCEHNAMLKSKTVEDQIATQVKKATQKQVPTDSCPSITQVQQAAKSYLSEQGVQADRNDVADVVCQGGWAVANLTTYLSGGGTTDGAVVLKLSNNSWRVTSIGSSFSADTPECRQAPPKVHDRLGCG